MIDTINIRLCNERNYMVIAYVMDYWLHQPNIKKPKKFSEFDIKPIYERAENGYKITGFTSLETERYKLDGRMNSPSWTYYPRVSVSPDFVTIELSLPKYIFQTNCFEVLNHSPYKAFVRAIKYLMSTMFPNIKIDYSGVTLHRWDFCFNQHYTSHEESINALEIMKLKNKKMQKHQMNIQHYKYGITAVTTNSYFKVYHKGIEFQKNDKQELLKSNYFESRILQNIENFSMNVLRYEARYSPKSVIYEINKHFYEGTVEFDYYKKYLNDNTYPLDKQIKKHFTDTPILHLGKVPKYNYGLTDKVGAHHLDETLFNKLYLKFLYKARYDFEIKKDISTSDKLRIQSKSSIDKKISIILKAYKSLENAMNKTAITERTYYRYKAYLRKNNFDSAKIAHNVIQHWDINHKLVNMYRNGINHNAFAPNQSLSLY